MNQNDEITLCANSFQNLTGAYLDKYQIAVILRADLVVLQSKGLLSPGNEIGVRFSTDGVINLWKKNNTRSTPFEVVTLQLLIPNMKIHRPEDVLVTGISQFKENANNLAYMLKEMDMNACIIFLKKMIEEMGFRPKEMESADWMAIVAMKNLDQPNAKVSDDGGKWCPVCLLSKKEILSSFADDYLWIPPHPSNILLRYDFGHGIAAVTTKLIQSFHDLCPKGSHQPGKLDAAIVKLFAPRFNTFGRNSKLGWSDVKILYFDKWEDLDSLSNVFADGIKIDGKDNDQAFPLLAKGRTTYYTYSKLFHIALVSLASYLYFAYTPSPTATFFNLLDAASKGLKFVFAQLPLRPTITFHFLTTHAVLFAKEDGTAYTTLQEGVEAKNKQTRKLAHNTFRSKLNAQYVSLLDHLTLRYLLSHLSSNTPHSQVIAGPRDKEAFLDMAKEVLGDFWQ